MTGKLLQLVAGSKRIQRTEAGVEDDFTKLGKDDNRKRRFSHGPPYIENATDAAKLVGTSLGGQVARALQTSSLSLVGGRKVVNTPSSRGSMVSPEQRIRQRPRDPPGKLIGLVYK